MNEPLQSDDVDDPKVTDYAIGSAVVYAALAWSEVWEDYTEVRRLAERHQVGFYYVSGNSEIAFSPD